MERPESPNAGPHGGAGQTLITTDHEVIRRWAEERGAEPMWMQNDEVDGAAGTLGFDVSGGESDGLEHVSWEEWLDTFDRRGLRFVYQERPSEDGGADYFGLERPDGH